MLPKEKKNKKEGKLANKHMTCMSNRWSQTRRRIIFESKVVTQSFHKSIFVDILGPLNTWLRPQMKYSEWDYVRTLYRNKQVAPIIRISTATVFSILIPVLGFGYFGRSLIHGAYEKKPIHYAGHEYGDINTSLNEEWWYLSGTGVNEDLQGANAIQLAHIFKRQIRLFRGETNGVLFDLAKSILGLATYKSAPAKRLALALLIRFNENPSGKTILIGHSYGTIIIINAMKYLMKKGFIDCLRTFEIYTFGCPCIDIPSTIDPVSFRRVPFYEHYVHIGDFVARIGAYRLLNGHHWVVGKVFTSDKQGHLLGEHYLPTLVLEEFQWEGGNHHSRLMSYIRNDMSRDQLRLELAVNPPSIGNALDDPNVKIEFTGVTEEGYAYPVADNSTLSSSSSIMTSSITNTVDSVAGVASV